MVIVTVDKVPLALVKPDRPTVRCSSEIKRLWQNIHIEYNPPPLFKLKVVMHNEEVFLLYVRVVDICIVRVKFKK